MDFAVPLEYRVKIEESEKSDTYPYLAIGCGWCIWENPQKFGKRTSRDHPEYSIIKIGQNNEKCPGDFLSLKLQWETISHRW